MATIGLISVACAIATVLGIALYIFGVARKAKMMKLSAVLTFLIGFGGLIFILSKYGAHNDQLPISEQAVQWSITEWTKTTETEGGTLHITDMTRGWNKNPKVIIEGDRVRFGDGQTTWVQRGVVIEGDSWTFSSESNKEGPPLTGSYQVTQHSENELELSKSDGLTNESIMMIKMK